MKKMMFVFIGIVCYYGAIKGQTIDIDNVRYSFSGANAIVSKYLGGEGVCVIPDTITYNGLDYTVTIIGIQAFETTSVTEVRLPETITTIKKYAFNGCQNLVKINLPTSLTIVEANAFSRTALTQIIIPESTNFEADYFYEDFFDGCNTLRTIIYLGKTAPTNWTATSNTYVPDKTSYSSPRFSMNDAHIIEMITFEKNEFEYTGQAPATTWKNNVEGYTATLSMDTLNGDVGSHEVWIPVLFTKGDVSFTVDVVYRYTIKPAKLIAKASNVNREYGDENPQLNVSYSGFVYGEDESVITNQVTASTTAKKTSNVGDYAITISGGSAKNYELVYEPGVLTVTKAPLSAKIRDATKTYGSQNPAFTIEYYGLKNGETAPAWTTSPTFQTEATKRSNVGNYEVTAINGVPVNYDCGDITAGTLTITPAPLTIKANDATMQYYSDEPNLGYTCNGFVNGENENVLSPKPTLATTANKYSSVGTYPIKVSGASNSNYSISYIDGTLTITPRTLYASVGNYERLYNENNPVFEVKYDGFVGNEDENVLGSKAVTSTTATKTSDVGSYPINVTGGSADNYKFSYRSGTLTINKAEQTISWEQDLSNLKVGDQVELQAIASSGLPITYTMDSNGLAEIYSAGNGKMYLDCKAEGIFTIRASQDGNKNYYSSTRINKTVSIGKTISYEFDAEGIHYLIGENNTVSVTSKPEKYSGDIVIPNQVNYNGTNYTVTSIGSSAFEGCVELASVSIPGSVTTIGDAAFYYCTGLTTIDIPNGVKTIGEGAFSKCSGLTLLTIPGSVTSIGINAFFQCYGLTQITSGIENPFAIDNGVFPTSVYNNASLFVPFGTKSAYQNTEGWRRFQNIYYADGIYTLTYYVDGEEYKSVNYEYGTKITPEPAPTKEGYTFSGWSEIPSTMPAEEVNVVGSFTINQYTITYMIDGEKYASETVDYNSKIVPPTPASKDGFDFAWEEYPETMPAHDITINGAYTTTGILSIALESGKAKIFTLDGRQVDTPQKGINIIRMDDGTIKKVVLGK